MHEKAQRIFVGNIPPGVGESDLQQEFAAYGTVQHVDLKTKDNLVDPGNPNIFAFISLEISDQMIKTCIAEFASTQYRGRYLTVSVARESFLDRLKREREEAAKTQRPKQQATKVENTEQKAVKSSVNGTGIIASTTKIQAVKKTKAASSSSESDSESSEDSSSDEEEVAATKTNTVSAALKKDLVDDEATFISKKNASGSLQNGKIKIQSLSAEPIHIISKKGKESKHLEGSAHQSDQKRKESLNKMKNQYNQQKLAIQQALSSVDTGKSNKILFESNDIEEKTNNLNHQQNQDKRNLFDGDDDEEGDEEMEDYSKDFHVKTQFQGRDGEKLMKLQSKFKLDPRFAMNSRFLDDEQGYEQDQELPAEENEERNWQMGIIEQVVGKSLESVPDPNRKKIKNQMTRFDPSKEDHKRFYRTGDEEDDSRMKSNKKTAITTTDSTDVEVSKDQFYNVSEDLTKSLRRRGDGFSLLSMFGRADDNQHDNDKKSSIYNEKPLIKSKLDAALNNPFKFDSSDSENEDDRDVSMKSDANNDDSKMLEKKTSIKVTTTGGKINKTGIWTENFFIFNIDQRFDDGAAFFKAHRKDNADNELEQDYDEIKRNLRNIIQRKMVKKRKNVDGFKTRSSKFKKTK